MVQPSPPRQSFWQIYRRQYRQPENKATQVLRIIAPVALLVVTVFVHTMVFSIVAGAVAVLLLAIVIGLTLRQRHKHPDQS